MHIIMSIKASGAAEVLHTVVESSIMAAGCLRVLLHVIKQQKLRK